MQRPYAPTYVVSSYSINDGPTTVFNATENAGYQFRNFQQQLFQSPTLNDSVTHTIVVTLVTSNNDTFSIDYFLIVPAGGATSTSASSSVSSDSSTIASASASAQSNPMVLVPLGPVVGGTLCGLALIVIAILAFLLCRRRRKDRNRKRESNFLLFRFCGELALNFSMYHRQ